MGNHVRVSTLTRSEAEHAWRGLVWGRERLIISDAGLFFQGQPVELRSQGDAEMTMTVFPPVTDWPLSAQGGTLTVELQESAQLVRVHAPERQPEILLKDCGAGRFQIDLVPEAISGLSDIFLQFDYDGDVGSLYLEGRLIADNYNNATPWQVGLKQFLPEALAHGLVARFWPLRKGQLRNTSTPMANRIEFDGDEVFRLRSFKVIPEYGVRVS